MAVALNIDRLTKRFGDVVAMDDLSLDIRPGELFFLLGPSGCGKTTLLRSIAGFCEPDAGCIRIGGEDITRVPPHKRDTGMVFQSYALWPHMTVRENVAFGLEMRNCSGDETSRRVQEALDRVRMSDKGDARPNQLSGGQQQRVALARALVIRPRCLLLDEPLSNLDAKLRLEMRSEIRRICKESDLTAVYVTHDQKEALSIADRLAILDRGRIQQLGTPAEVYRKPCSIFVAGFIGETNLLPGTVESAGEDSLAVSTPIGTLVSGNPSGLAVKTGMRVTVSLRPEALRLGPSTARHNRFACSVHHTVYLGEVAQHQVTLRADTTDPQTLKVFELNPQILARDQAADSELAVDPADVVVLPAS